jgi:hypothetical protein
VRVRRQDASFLIALLISAAAHGKLNNSIEMTVQPEPLQLKQVRFPGEIGWIGSTGQQGHEFAVCVCGKGFNFEVGETQVLGISSDETIRREVEERIRNQMHYAVTSR